MPTTTGRLTWDNVSEHFWETGTDRGVLYVQNADGTYANGVAWSGLTAVTESPSGADENAQYADNIKYLSLRGAEEFGGTIECFYYPEEWKACDGSQAIATGVTIGQQKRSSFGFAFRTRIGNETVGDDLGYKIHLVYGATASPSDRSYQTVNDSPEPITFSYEFSTVPVSVPGFRPTAIVTIDSTKFITDKEKAALAAFEDVIYGKDATTGESPTAAVAARLPLPDEVASLLTVVGG